MRRAYLQPVCYDRATLELDPRSSHYAQVKEER
jgi:hypothetical protein